MEWGRASEASRFTASAATACIYMGLLYAWFLIAKGYKPLLLHILGGLFYPVLFIYILLLIIFIYYMQFQVKGGMDDDLTWLPLALWLTLLFIISSLCSIYCHSNLLRSMFFIFLGVPLIYIIIIILILLLSGSEYRAFLLILFHIFPRSLFLLRGSGRRLYTIADVVRVIIGSLVSERNYLLLFALYALPPLLAMLFHIALAMHIYHLHTASLYAFIVISVLSFILVAASVGITYTYIHIYYNLESHNRDKHSSTIIDLSISTFIVLYLILVTSLFMPIAPGGLSGQKSLMSTELISTLEGYILSTLVLTFFIGLTVHSAKVAAPGISIGHIGFALMVVEGCYPRGDCLVRVVVKILSLVGIMLVSIAVIITYAACIDFIALLSMFYVMYLKRMYLDLASILAKQSNSIIAEYIEDLLEGWVPYAVIGYGTHGSYMVKHHYLFSSTALRDDMFTKAKESVSPVLVLSAATPQRPITRNFDPALMIRDLVVIEKNPLKLLKLKDYLAYIKMTRGLPLYEVSPEPIDPSLAAQTLPEPMVAIPVLNMDASAIQIDLALASLPYMTLIITIPSEKTVVKVMNTLARAIRRIETLRHEIVSLIYLPQQLSASHHKGPQLFLYKTYLNLVVRQNRCQLSVSYPYPKLRYPSTGYPSIIQVPSDCYAAWSLAARL